MQRRISLLQKAYYEFIDANPNATAEDQHASMRYGVESQLSEAATDLIKFYRSQRGDLLLEDAAIPSIMNSPVTKAAGGSFAPLRGGSAAYEVFVRFIVSKTKYHVATRLEFARLLQDALYNEGGMAGGYEVTNYETGPIFDLALVNFNRYLCEDEEYANEREPDNLAGGLLSQFKAELDEALPDGMTYEVLATTMPFVP